MDKVDHLRGKRFLGVPFVRETWIKWAIGGVGGWGGGGDDFKAYHLLGKHLIKWVIGGGNDFKVYHL